MLSETTQKVKRKIINVSNALIKKKKIDRPTAKFISEAVIGMILTKSCNLTKISDEMKEDIEIKYTLKRIQRNVRKNGKLLSIANEYLIGSNKSRIKDKTIIALDGGDITHLYGKKFEKIAKVRDGSSKTIRNGYHLNQISCYDAETRETFPLLLNIYSTEDEEFKSSNKETFKILEQYLSVVGNKGLWVMDRGYDGGIVLKYFLDKGLKFTLRMRKNRDLYYKGKRINIEELSESINLRYKSEKGRYGYLRCYLPLSKNDKREVTLVSYRGKRNKERMIFLCEGHIRSKREILERIESYFHRWGVEECYRFEKQGFQIEKSQVIKFEGIKCLLGLILLAWQVLLQISKDEALKTEIMYAAKREKNKLKDLPKFLYYRLLDGISNLFKGVRMLFAFRKSWYNKPKLKPKGFFDDYHEGELNAA